MSKTPDNGCVKTGCAARYYVTVDGETFEVYVDGENDDNIILRENGRDTCFHAEQKEKEYEILVSRGQKKIPVSIENSGKNISVFFGCREGKVTVKSDRDILYEKYHAASEQEASELKLVSPLPGLVTAVLAEPGDTVSKDDGIVIIEAMKMENEIKAPRDCVVREINVTTGKAIDKGHVIAVLE